MRALLLAGLGLCVWPTQRPTCNDCRTEDVWFTLTDGTPIFGRLYMPETRHDHLPAVVVCHGYLANLGFMEIPWAQDLSRLGVVALFLDRRGHGRSGGRWWPPVDPSPRLLDAALDIRAAVDYLRSRSRLVDPTRIALIGHSDGATGALMAASADWDIAATVALGASLVPWEFVNHVAPANLLLLYGADDRFILDRTDAQLIRSATRGYLDGEGMMGQLHDGSARRLKKIAGRGHIDLLFSTAARRETLRWVAQAFDLHREIVLSPTRLPWMLGGYSVLLLLVLGWHGWPRHLSLRAGDLRGWLMTALLTGLWTLGLALAAWLKPSVTFVPLQEGAVVVSILGVELALMTGAALVHTLAGTGRLPEAPSPRVLASRTLASNIGRGAAAGVAFQIAFEALLKPVYETLLDRQHLLSFVLFLPLALLAFVAMGGAGTAVVRSNRAPACGVPIEVFLALVTAAGAGMWFTRMSMLPVLLLAVALLLVGAYRAAAHPGGVTGAAAFGAVVYARCAALVCALY